MRTEPKISDADLILDELDRLARSTDSNAQFWRHYLTSLKALVNAMSAAILLPIENYPTPVAQQGTLSQETLAAFESEWQKTVHAEFWSGETPSSSWVVVPMRPQDSEYAWLLVSFEGSLSAASLGGLTALLQAFAEVYSTRDAVRRNRRMEKSWELFKRGFQQLSRVDGKEELYRGLVDQLVQVLGAARVTLVIADQSHGSSMRVTSTSGVSKVEATAPTVKALASLALKAASDQRPIFAMDPLADPTHDIPNEERLGDDGIFENRLVIPWEAKGEAPESEWMIIEWPNRESMADALPSIAPTLAMFHSAYRQQTRWCSIPKWMQQRVRRLDDTSSRRRSRTLRRVGIAFACATLIWGLLRPFPMSVEAEGILEPVSRRMVHATADGILLELYVDDGDTVVKNQKLAELRSPGLELQIEDALGQMRAMIEKRNGLHVAINQLSPTSQESLPTQTRISTDLLILEAQEKHLREKLEFLKREQERLILTSPIDGVVVASQLRRELENRPLRRGDTLFQIVELTGDWQLRVYVTDRDSGYVETFYESDVGRTVDYVFDSSPSERLRGKVTHLANTIEYQLGAGGHRSVLVAIDRNDAERAHMGAKASVSFECGNQPFWFVWSRPLVEFLQKRFGLFSKRTIPLSAIEPSIP